MIKMKKKASERASQGRLEVGRGRDEGLTSRSMIYAEIAGPSLGLNVLRTGSKRLRQIKARVRLAHRS
jgi:hypothetical protein